MLTLFPVPVKSCFIEAHGFYLVNFSSVNVNADGHLISVEQSECTHVIAERSKSNSGSDSGSADDDRCNSGREDRQRRR